MLFPEARLRETISASAQSEDKRYAGVIASGGDGRCFRATPRAALSRPRGESRTRSVGGHADGRSKYRLSFITIDGFLKRP